MAAAIPGWRERLEGFVTSAPFERFIIAVILFNAVTLGLETVPWAMDRFGPVLLTLDHLALAIFVVEIALKLVAMGPPPAHWMGSILEIAALLSGVRADAHAQQQPRARDIGRPPRP